MLHHFELACGGASNPEIAWAAARANSQTAVQPGAAIVADESGKVLEISVPIAGISELRAETGVLRLGQASIEGSPVLSVLSAGRAECVGQNPIALRSIRNEGQLLVTSGSALGVAGDFGQAQTGRLEVQLGASSVPVQCIGASAWAGGLHINFAGRLPRQGERFTVVTCGSRTGEFASISNDLQDRGLGLQAGYSDTGVTITVITVPPLSADLDGDGDVDQDDGRIFQDCTTGPALGPVAAGCEAADFDRDRDVDQEDFGLLQRCLTDDRRIVDGDCLN